MPLALALALCLGLTVPAFATDMKLEKFTPTVEGYSAEDYALLNLSEGMVGFYLFEDGEFKSVGAIDWQGNTVIPAQYDNIDYFREGLVTVWKDGKWGYFDKTGKEVTPVQYDDCDYFYGGFAKVQKDGKWGFIDKTGKEVIPYSYEDAYHFFGGLAKVQKDGKWGFIDKTGKEVVPIQYDEIGYFYEGLAAVKKDNKWGFIDKTGKEVIPYTYEQAYDFSGGLAAVKKDNKWGFIDKTGKEVIPYTYKRVRSFLGGLAAVKKDNKWGFIDKTGKEVIPCSYESVRSFFEGLAAVEQDGKWGFIDKTGKLVISCKYDVVGDFLGGFAAVGVLTEFDDVEDPVYRCGFIDETGEEVVPPATYMEGDVEYFENFTASQLNFLDGYMLAERYGYGDTPPENYYACYTLTVDAKVSDWAREQVNLAAANRLMPDGLGDDFTAKITRAEFAALAVKLYEALGGYEDPAVEQNPFSDTTDPMVLRANALGIVQGANGKFRPDDLVSRQDAAVMLSRVYTKLGGEIPTVTATSFADDSAIDGYAKSAVAFMADNGIITGKGNNTFAPKGQNGNASIEEAMVIALRMLKKPN